MVSADSSVRRDPAVRKDGRCARQGCNRMRPIAVLTGKKRRELIRYAGAFQLERDPFCSSRCARAFHGCSLASEEDLDAAEARSEAGRRGKAAGPLSTGKRIAA